MPDPSAIMLESGLEIDCALIKPLDANKAGSVIVRLNKERRIVLGSGSGAASSCEGRTTHRATEMLTRR